MRTNTTYFANCTTLEELKATYKKLALQYHPDRPNGDLEIMKAINLQYEKAFELLKDTHKTKEGKAYRKTTNEAPTDFIDLINQLLRMDGIHIEVIGCFIWISGDTKPHKEVLKTLGFRWHTAKKMWYKAPQDYKKYTNKKYSIEEVLNMYGVQFEADGKGFAQIEG